jgi:hypothetical protein
MMTALQIRVLMAELEYCREKLDPWEGIYAVHLSHCTLMTFRQAVDFVHAIKMEAIKQMALRGLITPEEARGLQQ